MMLTCTFDIRVSRLATPVDTMLQAHIARRPPPASAGYAELCVVLAPLPKSTTVLSRTLPLRS